MFSSPLTHKNTLTPIVLTHFFFLCHLRERAYTALHEALKGRHDSWKIWENMLYVSLDIGQFVMAVRAYHRIIDLRGKFLDHLVRTVCFH